MRQCPPLFQPFCRARCHLASLGVEVFALRGLIRTLQARGRIGVETGRGFLRNLAALCQARRRLTTATLRGTLDLDAGQWVLPVLCKRGAQVSRFLHVDPNQIFEIRAPTKGVCRTARVEALGEGTPGELEVEQVLRYPRGRLQQRGQVLLQYRAANTQRYQG